LRPLLRPDLALPGSTTIAIVAGASTLSTTAYSPNPITVPVGTTVSWLNNDSTTHTAVANGGAFTSPNLDPGRRFNFTFTTAGSFPYRCTIHPNMVGTITVQ
jgi:plastocyanin